MILVKILQLPRIFFKLSFILFITSCNSIKSFTIEGTTMGTTYEIKINSPIFVNTSILKKKIDRHLDDINMVFSTYIDSSEISIINKSFKNKIYVSDIFSKVMLESLHWANESNGFYDPTVYPLVDLWGFAVNKNISIPQDSIIQRTLKRVSYKNIELKENMLLKKNGVHVDLSSLAKGYAVDFIAIKLIEAGYFDFMVDIGGELICKGNNNKKNWIIGIAHPMKDDVFLKTIINDFSIATSGTYNNYTTYNGEEYSHIINPVTGYPVNNSIISATVISESCMVSDAIATMLMVLPYNEGIDIINRRLNTECLILVNDKKKIISIESENFKKHIIN